MTPDHGTRARYSRGCRCDECRVANTAYDRALRARAGLPDERPVPVDDPTRPAARGKVADRIEDLEFLLSVGEDPVRAVERVGWSMSAADRALNRHGRFALAARIRERVAV